MWLLALQACCEEEPGQVMPSLPAYELAPFARLLEGEREGPNARRAKGLWNKKEFCIAENSVSGRCARFSGSEALCRNSGDSLLSIIYKTAAMVWVRIS